MLCSLEDYNFLSKLQKKLIFLSFLPFIFTLLLLSTYIVWLNGCDKTQIFHDSLSIQVQHWQFPFSCMSYVVKQSDSRRYFFASFPCFLEFFIFFRSQARTVANELIQWWFRVIYMDSYNDSLNDSHIYSIKRGPILIFFNISLMRWNIIQYMESVTSFPFSLLPHSLLYIFRFFRLLALFPLFILRSLHFSPVQFLSDQVIKGNNN